MTRSGRGWRLIAALGVVAALPAAPAAFAWVRVSAGTARKTAAVERALNAVHGCGFSTRADYVWMLEVASNGWAMGAIAARNPANQGDGVFLVHYYRGRWHYVTCGSDLGYSNIHPPGYPPFPGPLVHRLARAMHVIRIHKATTATINELEAVTTTRGWCPDDSGTLWPVRISTVGWAVAMLDGLQGVETGSCVVIYTREQNRWRPFAHGMTDDIWTSARNVPAIVLLDFESAMQRALGAN